MVDFKYEEMFPISKDETEYNLITKDYVSSKKFEGEDVLIVEKKGLELLSETAMKNVSHFLRAEHLKKVAAILDDNEASDNDKYVAGEMLKNAEISSQGEFPLCQDTGTAVIVAKKGQKVWTNFDDKKALSKGIFNAYTKNNLRYSQNAPITMFEEKNTGCNLPAQIDIYAEKGGEYKFLFLAKGGGSANKTYLYQETKALLHPDKIVKFLTEKMKTLGTAACPPYHLAFVIGGTSAETNLKTVKLASAKYLDNLPTKGSESGHAFRDIELENKLYEESRKLGLGAQFGGKNFCLDVRVVRLPRHGASFPIGMGVSCSADRNVKAKITADGIFLEKLETDLSKYLKNLKEDKKESTVEINLNQPMDKIRETLTKYPVATRLLLNGKIIVGRDIAHAKLAERLEKEGKLPDYIKNHVIYYAGPAKTPEGYASGSFGPTTAGRMDSYVPIFQAQGGSMVMLAKGNRSQVVTDACKKYGGFYLGSIGGPAARLGRDCIKSIKVLEYEELGMEAIYEIEVENFPAFILVDDKGNDFFDGLL